MVASKKKSYLLFSYVIEKFVNMMIEEYNDIIQILPILLDKRNKFSIMLIFANCEELGGLRFYVASAALFQAMKPVVLA